MFKDYLRSYKEDKLVEFANNIMYNGKILKVVNEQLEYRTLKTT